MTGDPHATLTYRTRLRAECSLAFWDEGLCRLSRAGAPREAHASAADPHAAVLAPARAFARRIGERDLGAAHAAAHQRDGAGLNRKLLAPLHELQRAAVIGDICGVEVDPGDHEGLFLSSSIKGVYIPCVALSIQSGGLNRIM